MSKWLKWWTIATLAVLLGGCGYNEFQAKDEAIKAAWSEVVNQYQRRADLVPNLVNTVKGYASHEKDTLEAVTRARAAATSIQVTPEVLNDPAAFQKFQQAQGELSSALSRLMAVSENYPQLKADSQFPRPAVAAGRHRKPHHRGAPALYRSGAGLQRAGAQFPDQPDRDDVPLRGQAHPSRSIMKRRSRPRRPSTSANRSRR